MVSNAQKQTMDELVDDLRKFWDEKIAKHKSHENNTKFSKHLSTIKKAYSKDDFYTAEQFAADIHSWACGKSDYCEGTEIGFDYFDLMDKSGAVEYLVVDTSPHPEHVLKTLKRDTISLEYCYANAMRSFIDKYIKDPYNIETIPEDIRQKASLAFEVYNSSMVPAIAVIKDIPDNPEDKVYGIKTILEKSAVDMKPCRDAVEGFIGFCLGYKGKKPISMEFDACKMKTTLKEFDATVRKMNSEIRRLPKKIQRQLAA